MVSTSELDQWEVGRDEYAEPVTLRLSNVPGVCIAGLPGYGRTSAINGFLADFAPSPAIQFRVVDDNGSADYEDRNTTAMRRLKGRTTGPGAARGRRR